MYKATLLASSLLKDQSTQQESPILRLYKNSGGAPLTSLSFFSRQNIERKDREGKNNRHPYPQSYHDKPIGPHSSSSKQQRPVTSQPVHRADGPKRHLPTKGALHSIRPKVVWHIYWCVVLYSMSCMGRASVHGKRACMHDVSWSYHPQCHPGRRKNIRDPSVHGDLGCGIPMRDGDDCWR